MRPAILVLVAGAVLVSCGDDAPSAHEGPADARLQASDDWPCPFTEAVCALRRLPEQERGRQALELAQSLPAGHAVRRKYFGSFAWELVAQKQWSVIRFLDAELALVEGGSEKRHELRTALAHMNRCTGVELRRMARHDPTSIALAPYRPGGIEYLLEVLSRTSSDPAHIYDRFMSVQLLGSHGDTSVIDRLREFENEPTPFIFGKMPNDNQQTLGDWVKTAIEKIRRRSGQ